MANLVLCAECNLACAYCFARDNLHTAAEDQAERGASTSEGRAFLSLDELERRLDWLDRSGITEVRFIGGEPTLHPFFSQVIARARRRSKPILVFSHGLIASRSLDALMALSPDECTVLVNMNASRHLDGPTEAETRRRAEVVRQLGPRALLGWTIARPVLSLEPLLALIQEAHSRRVLRVGLAQPAPQRGNRYLHPKQYLQVGRALAEFAPRAAEAGVSLELDCGFVRCMFSEPDLAQLRACGAQVDWRCSPVLDIDLNNEALHCFPLADRSHTPFFIETAANLRAQLAARVAPWRQAGIYAECSDCAVRRAGDCSGGCLAQTLQRFRPASFSLRIPQTVFCSHV